MSRKLTPKLKSTNALEMTRIAIGHEKLAYILLADKPFSYPHGGKSRIAYIGTTKKGAARIAGSMAERAKEILGEHGVKKVVARVITCRPRRRVKTWKKLESALLLMFRREYGRVPW